MVESALASTLVMAEAELLFEFKVVAFDAPTQFGAAGSALDSADS
jgi:hypothetical protein